MSTQHFCQFLKGRREKNNGRCLSCDTKLSQYNSEEFCFSCQDKLKEERQEKEMLNAWLEEGPINVPTKKHQPKSLVMFYRSCGGKCRGNGQTIFGEADPVSKTIIIDFTQAINWDGRCGQCGGPITLFRDRVPRWAEGFSIVLSASPSSTKERPIIRKGVRL